VNDLSGSTKKFSWEQRYADSDNLFGRTPSELLLAWKDHFRTGLSALAVGDGEGRNGVWLAEQGLDVLSIDISSTALSRAEGFAAERGVKLQTECADLLTWQWPQQSFDIITSIFVHMHAELRQQVHQSMLQAIRPGGLILIEGYHTDQCKMGSGGPSDPSMMFTPELLKEDFPGMTVLHAEVLSTDVVMDGNQLGKGAACHFVAQKPSL